MLSFKTVATSLLTCSLFAPVVALAAPADADSSDQGNDETAAFAADQLSSEQISGIVQSASRGEIQLAKIAQSHARNGKVKAFADKMIEQAQANGTRFDAVVSKLGVQPTASSVSLELEANRLRDLTALRLVEDLKFDRVFMQQQVDAQRKVLDILDMQLLPVVQNADLKAFLTEARASVAANLTEAEAILNEVKG